MRVRTKQEDKWALGCPASKTGETTPQLVDLPEALRDAMRPSLKYTWVRAAAGGPPPTTHD